MIARCIECGGVYDRRASETWRVRCYACWAARRAAPVPAAPSRIESELGEHLRALTQLCHPDRHGGSPLATSITAWLLRVRRELRA